MCHRVYIDRHAHRSLNIYVFEFDLGVGDVYKPHDSTKDSPRNMRESCVHFFVFCLSGAVFDPIRHCGSCGIAWYISNRL